MGLFARNFGGNGGSSPGPDPLEPYYAQLIALATTYYTGLSTMAPAYETIMAVASTMAPPICNRTAAFIGSTVDSYSWANEFWNLAIQGPFTNWYWGSGRKSLIRYTGDPTTIANNDYLAFVNIAPPFVPNVQNPANETRIVIEFKVDETFVPTPDSPGIVHYTADITGVTTINIVVLIVGTIIVNNLAASIIAAAVDDYTADTLQRRATGAYQNEAAYDFTSYFANAGFAITEKFDEPLYQHAAWDSLDTISRDAGIMSAENQVIPLLSLPIAAGVDPSNWPYDVSRINGKDYQWKPGTHLINKDTGFLFRHGGRVSQYGSQGMPLLKPLYRNDNTRAANTDVMISSVVCDLVPSALSGLISNPGNSFGPFEMVIEGFTLSDNDLETFELLINGKRLNHPLIKAVGSFAMRGAVADDIEANRVVSLTQVSSVDGLGAGVELTGSGRQNTTNTTGLVQLPFRIKIKVSNPGGPGSIGGAGLKGQLRYIETELQYSSDGSLPNGGCTDKADCSLYFQETSDGDGIFPIGPITQIGIISLQYDYAVEHKMMPAAIMTNCRYSLFFTS